ncbi:MAG TPA: hypothetical protein VNA89_03445 [Gemmatimonadaceae bacterium]|nr:hypothetical protein [Gemmatimonadaceae bacterium]
MPTPPALVVKLGGALLAAPGALAGVAAAAPALVRHRALVVPGGGPFAEAVRAADRTDPLPDETAHWMAVLAMDQYAHLLAARLPGATLVDGPEAIAELSAVGAGCLPVLAPYRWLRAADPLPHGWQVTSDSIAAWVAGALGAPRLLLVKAARGPLASIVDGYFAAALPRGVEAVALTPEELIPWLERLED